MIWNCKNVSLNYWILKKNSGRPWGATSSNPVCCEKTLTLEDLFYHHHLTLKQIPNKTTHYHKPHQVHAWLLVESVCISELRLCMHTQSLSLRLTLCASMDCSLQGTSVHGILWARLLEQGAISFSWGSSWPRDETHVSVFPASQKDSLLLKPLGKL